MSEKLRAHWTDDGVIFFGSGSTHTLTDAGGAPHRLAGLRSVKTLVSLRDPPPPPLAPIGFYIPRNTDR